MHNPASLRFAKSALLAFSLALLWSCNVNEAGKTTFLDLKLEDSLSVEKGLYDSVRVDIYDGKNVLAYPGIFSGPYNKTLDSAKLASLNLGSNAPDPMRIEILAFKGGREALKFTIAVENKQASSPIATVIDKPIEPLGPGFKAPIAIIIAGANPLILSVGDAEVTLHASVLPDSASQGIRWTSSDSLVARIMGASSVKPGISGSAVLTAYSIADAQVFAKKLVTVAPVGARPASINIETINPLALSLQGTPVFLNAKVSPPNADPRIEWVSLNPAIAAIENGNYVRPLAIGDAALIARSVEDTLIKSSLAVTVQADAIAAKKVTIATTNPLTLSVGATAVPLVGSIEPLGASQGLIWTSSDLSVASISIDNQVKGLKVGTATITATSETEPTLTAVMTVNVQADLINPTTVLIETSSPLVLIVGSQSVQLKGAIAPPGANPEINWTSANTGIAIIENGNFAKGLVPGETEFTAMSKADTSIKKTLAVKVQYQVVLPKSITLLVPDSMTLAIGASEGVLAAKVEPAGAKQEIVWSVADTSIVKLTAKGTVKPLKAGKTSISAKVKADATIARSMVVEVVEPVKVEGITMTPKNLLLYTGGDSGKVTIALQGSDPGARYTLTSSDPLVASVKTDGTVKGIKAGFATISASPVGYDTLIASCLVEVKTDTPVVSLSPSKDTTIGYSGEVTFTVSVTQAYGTVAQIQADLDGNGAYDTTVSGKSAAVFIRKYTSVGPVNPKFEVKDSEGNISIVTRKITVSAPGTPEVTITDPHGPISIRATTYILKFSVKDPVTGSTVVKDSTLTGLKEGANTITVTRSNAGGEGKDQAMITVDTKVPTIEITTTTTMTGTAGFTLSGKVGDVGTGVAKVSVTSAQATLSAGDAVLLDDGTWTKSGITLATGANILDAIATDKAGNVSAKVSLTVTVDNAGPVLAITPVSTPTSNATLTLSGSVSDAVSGVEKVVVSSAQAVVTAGNAIITAPTWSKGGITLVEGANTITVTATDKAGKTTTASIVVTLDTTPAGNPNSGSVATPTKSKTPFFTWKSGGGNGTFRVRMDVDNFSTGYTEVKVPSYTSATLSDGSHTLYVRETDGNGNWSGSLAIEVEVDATGPSLAVTSGAGTIGSTSTTLVFAVTDGGTGVSGTPTCKWGAKAFTVTKSGTAWSCAVTGLAKGANTVTLEAVDGVGNPGSATASINVSLPKAKVTILSPANNFVTNNPKPPITYTVVDGGTPLIYTPSTALSDGMHEITVSSPPNDAEEIGTANITVYIRSNVIFVGPVAKGAGNGSSWNDVTAGLFSTMTNGTNSGKEIWVEKGTYSTASGNWETANNIKIYGGFDGNLRPNSNALSNRPSKSKVTGAWFNVNEKGNVTVDGFTFSGTRLSLGTTPGNRITIANSEVVDQTGEFSVDMGGTGEILFDKVSITGNRNVQGTLLIGEKGAKIKFSGGEITENVVTNSWGKIIDIQGGAVVFTGGLQVSGNVAVDGPNNYQVWIADDQMSPSLDVASGVTLGLSQIYVYQYEGVYYGCLRYQGAVTGKCAVPFPGSF